MIACFAVRVVEIAQRRACTHLTSIIIIGARVVRRPRIQCRGRDCHARDVCASCARAPKVSYRLRQFFDIPKGVASRRSCTVTRSRVGACLAFARRDRIDAPAARQPGCRGRPALTALSGRVDSTARVTFFFRSISTVRSVPTGF